MAAAGAGRVSNIWRGRFVDEREETDSLEIVDAGPAGLPFLAWSPNSASGHTFVCSSVTAPSPAAPNVVSLSAPVDASPTISYTALGTPDAGGTTPPQQTTAAPSSFLVQFASGATAADKAAALAAVGGEITQTVRAGDAETGDLVVVQAAGQAADAIIGTLTGAPGVSFAEVNWQLGVQATANDSYYTKGSMWGMYGDGTSPANAYGSQAGEAWADGNTGSSTIVVGNIDTGIDYTHVDLYLNVWLNQGELPTTMALVDSDKDGLITFRDLNQSANAGFVSDLNTNGRIDAGDLLRDARWEDGIDESGNGYIDDLIGWDFVNNDNDPYDDNGHGTHTAGTVGATGGNGTGVAGVSWNVQIMTLKFLDKSGSGSLSNAVKALDYYTGASISDEAHDWTSEFIGTNNSWGGGGYSKSLLNAIVRSAQQDALFIAAAGNGGSDGRGDNNDGIANYPSNYSTLSAVGYEAVVAVAALTSSGALASYSNYGATTVDLGAPGSGIWSTTPGGGYASFSGTSMATPHVTGALALLASLHPDYTADQLRDALLSSTQATLSLAGKTVTGGRLDVDALIEAADATLEPRSSGSTVLSLYGTTSSDVLVGTSGGDILSGVPASGTNLGRGTIDLLYGQAGADVFILGDARGTFYNDGSAFSAGRNDFAVIGDFASGDKIQLASGNYFLAGTTASGVSGTGIFRDSNGRYDAYDELVGIVQNVSPTSMSNADFLWA